MLMSTLIRNNLQRNYALNLNRQILDGFSPALRMRAARVYHPSLVIVLELASKIKSKAPMNSGV